MAIDDNTLYGLTGAQVKELPEKIEAVKGLARVLTTDDYNYPTNNPDGVAIWLLPAGVYQHADTVKAYFSTASSTSSSGLIIVTPELTGSAVNILDSHTAGTGANSWRLRATKRTDGAVSVVPQTLLTTNYILDTTGTAQGYAISQAAATKMVFQDPSTRQKVQIGSGAASGNTQCMAIGQNAQASGGTGAIAIGSGGDTNTRPEATAQGAIALGTGAKATVAGEMNIGDRAGTGYNSSNYRLLTGVYDGQSNHDVATLAQGNKLMSAAPTTTDAGVLGQLWTDTTNMHTYQLGSIDTTDPDNPVYSWTQRW